MPGFLDYLVRPPMPGILQSGAGQPPPLYPSAPNWGEQRDPFAYAAPRPQPAGDVVLPAERPSFTDTMPRIGKSLHRNDARMFDYLPAAARGNPGNEWLNQNAPIPTQARPNPPLPQWTNTVPVLDPADTSNYGPGSPFGQTPPDPRLLAQMQAWWQENYPAER